MDSFIFLLFKTVDDTTYNTLNNLIHTQMLSFDINHTNNIYSVKLSSNNVTFNIDDFLSNKLSDLFTIITEEDYKSLIKLLYNDEQHIITYNNIPILYIQGYYKFNSNIKNVKKLQSKFQSILSS